MVKLRPQRITHSIHLNGTSTALQNLFTLCQLILTAVLGGIRQRGEASHQAQTSKEKKPGIIPHLLPTGSELFIPYDAIHRVKLLETQAGEFKTYIIIIL